MELPSRSFPFATAVTRCNHLLRTLLLLLVAILPAHGQDKPEEPPPPRPPGYRAPCPCDLPFLIRPEKWFSSPEQGMLMLCPAHAHGPKEQATAELIHLVAQHRSPAPATIWVCRRNQLEPLREFAPMVDRVCINPFVHNSNRRTALADPPWPNTAHPFLMQVQDLRRAAPGRQLVACIPFDGEEYRHGSRQPTFEEIEWLALAAVGSGFQGVAWRGDLGTTPYRDRLDALAGNLLRHADRLARAEPVDWVAALPADGAKDAPPRPHCSALRSGNRLFVVLLHPQYLDVPRDRLAIPLPIRPEACNAIVELRPPDGTTVAAAERLDGTPLALRPAGVRVLVPCRLAGGGTLVVLDLQPGQHP